MGIHINYSKHINDVQNEGEGEINTAKHTYSKNCVYTILVEGLNCMFLWIPQLCFTIKECKIDLYYNASDSICLISMRAHFLSVDVYTLKDLLGQVGEHTFTQKTYFLAIHLI